MGWSNNIPNPFTVGGGGLAGSILVYDANNVLVGRIDEDGMVAFGDGGSFVGLYPNVPNQFYGDTAGIQFQPNNPGTFPTILTDGQIIGGWAGPVGSKTPVLSLNAPGLETPVNEMQSFIDIYSPNRASNFPGSISIFAAGDFADDPYVDVTPKLQVQGFTVPASNAYVWGPSGAGNTTSGAYSDCPTPGAAFVVKLHTATRLKVTLSSTCYVGGVGDLARFGVRINGVDYDVCQMYFNVAVSHAQLTGTVYIASGLTGAQTYTVQPRWLRAAGGSALGIQRDALDWFSLSVEEVN